MNKIKCIPVLALAALLSSCSLFGAKAPKFADEGEQVDYTDFFNRYNDAYSNSELNDTNVKLTDRIIKTSNYEMNNSVLKRGNKEISKSEMTTNIKEESQFDVDNFVGKATSESKETMKGNNPEGNGSYSLSSKSENYYQFEKENSYTYLVKANTKTQEYRFVDQVSSSRKKDVVFDEKLRYEIVYFVELFYSYVPKTSFGSEDYLFYIKDDNLFTITLTKDETNNSSDYEYTFKRKLKIQLDLTDKKQALRISDETKTEYKYHINYDTYRDGDVVTTNQIMYAEYSVNSKNVNLSPIDVGDYIQRSFD